MVERSLWTNWLWVRVQLQSLRKLEVALLLEPFYCFFDSYNDGREAPALQFRRTIRSEIGGYKSYLMITLQMHFIDYDTTKGNYIYFHFKDFLHSANTLSDLCLAINSDRGFLHLYRMFPYGQNYDHLCQVSVIKWTVKIALKHEFEKLPLTLLPWHSKRKTAD